MSGGNYRGGAVDNPWAAAGALSPDEKRVRYAPPASGGSGLDGAPPPPFRDRAPLFPAAGELIRESRLREDTMMDPGPPRKRAPGSLPYDGPQAPYSEGDPPPNDCEIIAVGNPSPRYVAMVEEGIRERRMRVDVMIPKVNTKISSFIENLATRGVIFAVVIRPDNELHQSVSVHVLRGAPKAEEHRNMPLQTAYNLLQKRYVELKKMEVGVFPDNIKVILRYMLEDRNLTDNEYATVIAFLQERRKRQAAFESRTPFDGGQSIYCPEELQKKILSIFTAVDPGNDSKPMITPPIRRDIITPTTPLQHF